LRLPFAAQASGKHTPQDAAPIPADRLEARALGKRIAGPAHDEECPDNVRFDDEREQASAASPRSRRRRYSGVSAPASSGSKERPWQGLSARRLKMPPARFRHPSGMFRSYRNVIPFIGPGGRRRHRRNREDRASGQAQSPGVRRAFEPMRRADTLFSSRGAGCLPAAAPLPASGG
jgi:hypothetical protein